MKEPFIFQKIRGLRLLDEKPYDDIGMAVKRPEWYRVKETQYIHTTLREFLSKSENQGGTWLVDNGWGGPPGPRVIKWIDGQWVDEGWIMKTLEEF